MNIVVCSSRGKCLLPLNEREDTRVIVHGGGKIPKLTREATKILKDYKHFSGPKFVYFVAGLPDITTKASRHFWMKGHRHTYEEVSFQGSIEGNAQRVINIIRASSQAILAENAIPVYCTIIPCDIEIWNHIRLSQHRTSHLTHFHQYESMQESLLKSIRSINQFILHHNSQNQVATPKITLRVFYKRKSSWRFRSGRLTDGVHPDSRIEKSIRKKIIKILDTNLTRYSPKEQNRPESADSGSDSDTSCKRSWIY